MSETHHKKRQYTGYTRNWCIEISKPRHFTPEDIDSNLMPSICNFMILKYFHTEEKLKGIIQLEGRKLKGTIEDFFSQFTLVEGKNFRQEITLYHTPRPYPNAPLARKQVMKYKSGTYTMQGKRRVGAREVYLLYENMEQEQTVKH